MSKPEFLIQPQRSDGRGWVPCELHRATSFAVVKKQSFTRQGKRYKASVVIGRCSTKFQAEGLAQANRKSCEPMPKHLVRKLGRRIVKPLKAGEQP